ncbi:hypothetical protein K7432_009639, partial [Basidiobolus ranarum]
MSQVSSDFLQDAHRYYEILSARSRSRSALMAKDSNNPRQPRLRTQRSIEDAKEFCSRNKYHPVMSEGKPRIRPVPNVGELSSRLERYLQ